MTEQDRERYQAGDMASDTAPEHQMDRRSFITGSTVLGLGAMASLAGAPAVWASSASDSSADASSATASSTAASSATTGDTVEADFVIVGAGMGGFSAAIMAAQSGCKNIVLLEKNENVGGSSLFAEGIFGNGDSYQKQAGYDAYDTTEILAEETDWSHGVINQRIFKQYMDTSAEYIDWLLDLGVEFETLIDAGTGRYCMHLYKDGNAASAIATLSDVAASQYADVIDIRTSTRVTSLIMDGDKVVGVEATSADGSVADFKAPTILLATGGLASDVDLMDEYTKLDPGKWEHLGNVGQEGDGMKLAETTAHGRGKNVCACNMWVKVAGALVQSDANYAAGMEGSNIWVNENATRFCDESVAQQFFKANNTIVNQGAAFSIFDQTHVQFFIDNGTTCQWSGFCPFGTPMPDLQKALDDAAADDAIGIFKADTLEELAGLIGLDADALASTVEAWNAEVVAGVDEDLGKAADFQAAIQDGPFYAGRLVSGVLNTFGGVRINEQGQVCAPDGAVVEGLYAAGILCSGFSGEVYGMAAPGSNQGPAVYLGRLAGQAAAARM